MADKLMQGKSYEKKVEELESILRQLDDSAIPIDKPGAKAKTGAQLIIELQQQLESVETEVQDAFKPVITSTWCSRYKEIH